MRNRTDVKAIIHEILTVIFFGICIAACVHFPNAGNSFLQAVVFRTLVLSFGILMLLQLKLSEILKIYNLVYLIAGYIVLHFAYIKHWIADTCDYKFASVIRLGKASALVWGIVVIAVIRRILKGIKEEEMDFFAGLPYEWIVFAVLITLFNPGYTNALFFPICFGCAFFIMREEEERKLMIRSFMRAQVIVLILFSIFSLLFRPYDADERYMGYFNNSNSAGEFFACSYAVILVLCWKLAGKKNKEKADKIKAVLSLLLLCWNGVLVFYNYTRTVIVGLLLSLAVFVVFCVIRKGGRKLIRYGLMYLLLQLLLLYPGYLALRYIPAYVNRPKLLYAENLIESKVVRGDPVDSEKYTSLQEFFTLALGKMGIYVKFDVPERQEQTEAVVVDKDRDVTNGRKEIWAAFIGRLSFLGHYPGHIYLENADGEETLVYHAHNSYLQIFYQYGFLTFLSFAVMILLSFIRSAAGYLKSVKGRNRYMLPLLMSGLIAFAMMTEWIWHPAYSICFAYMTVYAYLVNEDRKEKHKREKEGEDYGTL